MHTDPIKNADLLGVNGAKKLSFIILYMPE
jgi:hypothetical protein